MPDEGFRQLLLVLVLASRSESLFCLVSARYSAGHKPNKICTGTSLIPPNLKTFKYSRRIAGPDLQELTHRKNLAFKCEVCGKSLRSNTFLKIHIRSVHARVSTGTVPTTASNAGLGDQMKIKYLKLALLVLISFCEGTVGFSLNP